MGLIFGAVGIGCILGPILANLVTRPDPAGFLRGIALSFVCLNFGYLLMALAPDIFTLMLASALRAQGSTVLWTYSTLILQLRYAPLLPFLPSLLPSFTERTEFDDSVSPPLSSPIPF